MPSIAEDLDRRTFLYNLIMPIMNRLDNSIFIPIYVMTYIYHLSFKIMYSLAGA